MYVDTILTKEEIEAAVRHLPRGKSPDPLGVSVDHYKDWLREYLAKVKWSTHAPSHPWRNLVELIQHICYAGEFLMRLPCSTYILLRMP